MIEKTTTNRNYPKPDAKNFLQDDITRLVSALDAIDTDIYTIKQEQTEQDNLIDTKADQTTVQSAIDTINTTKADKTEVDSEIAALREKVYGTAYNIIGPALTFQYARDLTYSIEIPDAAAYTWTATGVTITAGAATKSITVKTADISGSVSVSVTTAAGDTVQKTKEITVKQFSNIQTFEYTGSIESWTVPDNVELIKIEVWGAMGGNGYYNQDFKHYGGKGARMKGEFRITPGDKLLILVGGAGEEVEPLSTYATCPGSGGGGSFVVEVDPDSPHQMTVLDQEKVTPLVIAGGGGGGGSTRGGQNYDGGHAVVGSDGGDAVGASSGTNGSAGSSASHSSGGAGFLQNSPTHYYSPLSKSFLNGGTGGTGRDYARFRGGFGGGGGVVHTTGGGGGYSGGGTAGSYNDGTAGGAAGGGSYNTGMNQNNSPGVREGNGKVQISW